MFTFFLMSSENVTPLMESLDKQLHDINKHTSAPQIHEPMTSSTLKFVPPVEKISDLESPEYNEKGGVTGTSQTSTPRKHKIRRNKLCSIARKCWTGIKKGADFIVDCLYRLFEGKMMVILRGSCYCVWISLGILLGACAVPFAIAACSAMCLT